MALWVQTQLNQDPHTTDNYTFFSSFPKQNYTIRQTFILHWDHNFLNKYIYFSHTQLPLLHIIKIPVSLFTNNQNPPENTINPAKHQSNRRPTNNTAAGNHHKHHYMSKKIRQFSFYKSNRKNGDPDLECDRQD